MSHHQTGIQDEANLHRLGIGQVNSDEDYVSAYNKWERTWSSFVNRSWTPLQNEGRFVGSNANSISLDEAWVLLNRIHQLKSQLDEVPKQYWGFGGYDKRQKQREVPYGSDGRFSTAEGIIQLLIKEKSTL